MLESASDTRNYRPSNMKPKSAKSTKKIPPIRDAGLSDSWREKIKAVPPGAKTPAPRKKSEKDTGAVRETDGGLNDADVKTSRSTGTRGRSQQRKQVRIQIFFSDHRPQLHCIVVTSC